MRSSTEGATLAAWPAGVLFVKCEVVLKQQYERPSRQVRSSSKVKCAIVNFPMRSTWLWGASGVADVTCSRQVKDQAGPEEVEVKCEVVLTGPEALAALPANGSGGGGGDGCGDESADSVEGGDVGDGGISGGDDGDVDGVGNDGVDGNGGSGGKAEATSERRRGRQR